MSNRVNVPIEGDDRLSPLLDQIQAKIRGGVFEANLLGGALNQAFDLASRAVSGLTTGIQSAAAAQTDVIKSVGSLAETLGKPYEIAEKLNADITSGLAKYAAALPGETDTYIRLFRTVSDDVAETNKEMNNGVVNVEQYKDQVTQLTAKFAALGDGLNFAQLSNSISGLLGGQSIASLKQLEFFQNNPKFLKSLEGLLGSKEMKALSSGERLEMTLKALDMSLTDDTIKRLGGTFDGAIQGMKTTLFDPNTGIFGLLRDLDENMSGQQSAFDAINQATQALIGSDGLFFVLGDTLQKLGLDMGDPMLTLRNTVLWATEKIRLITTFFSQFNDMLGKDVKVAQQVLLINLGAQIKRISGEVFAWLGDNAPRIINGILDGVIVAAKGLAFVLANIDWGAAVVAIGKALTQIDWGKALMILGGILTAKATAALSVSLTGAALSKIMATAFVTKLTAMAPTVAATLLGPLGLAAAAVTTTVVSAYAQNWDSVVLGIQYSWSELGATLMADLNIMKAAMIGKFFELKMWSLNMGQTWDSALLGIQYSWSELGATATSGLNIFKASVMSLWLDLKIWWLNLNQDVQASIQLVKTAIETTIQLIGNRFQEAKSTVDGMISGVVSSVTGLFEGIKSAFSSLQSRIPFIGGGNKGSVDNKAGGYIPNAAGGWNVGSFLDAVGREVGLMPRGASPIIANSSELILNRRQQGALASAMAQPQGGGISIGSITITTQATDAQGIAKDLMAAIAQEFRAYQQSRLSSAF